MAIIKLLKECPDYAPILGYWTYMEWFRGRSIDFDIVVKAFKKRIDDSSLPISWVAIEDGVPAGMVSLKIDDLWSRKNLNPWLVSLYVAPEFRKHGIGSKLIESVISKTRELGLKNLYLYVSDDRWDHLVGYYQKRDWELVEVAPGNDNNKVKVFCYFV